MPDRDLDAMARLIAENERLRRSEWAARGERDSMKRRLELLTADESWWIGGAWGDYGEVVIPVRAVSMVLGQKMVDQDEPGAPELDPGLAATYRDLRATVEHLVSENDRLEVASGEFRDRLQEFCDWLDAQNLIPATDGDGRSTRDLVNEYLT